jgi:hypothetical protein
VSLNLNLREDLLDESVFPDDICRPLDVRADLAIQRLFSVCAVFCCHLVVRISQQWHVQLMFLAEFRLFVRAVCADAYRDSPLFFDLCFRIAELGCLARSTRRVRFWIEKEHNCFSPRVIV